MKNSILALGGAVTFWATWPYLYFHLRQSKRVRVLVTTETEVLLIRAWHGYNTWTLPGGGMKPEENPVATAQRELKEETFLTIGIDQFKALGNFTYKDRGLRFSCQYFSVRLRQRQPVAVKPPEIVEARWFPFERLSELSVGPDVQQALSAHNALLQ